MHSNLVLFSSCNKPGNVIDDGGKVPPTQPKEPEQPTYNIKKMAFSADPAQRATVPDIQKAFADGADSVYIMSKEDFSKIEAYQMAPIAAQATELVAVNPQRTKFSGKINSKSIYVEDSTAVAKTGLTVNAGNVFRITRLPFGYKARASTEDVRNAYKDGADSVYLVSSKDFDGLHDGTMERITELASSCVEVNPILTKGKDTISSKYIRFADSTKLADFGFIVRAELVTSRPGI